MLTHNMLHPEYNIHVGFDEWIPLNVVECGQILSMPNYQVLLQNNPTGYVFRSMNKEKVKVLSQYKSLSLNNKTYNALHCVLASAFPELATNTTVDHIDSNPKNNNVMNLRWMSLHDNCARANEGIKSMRSGKHICMIANDVVEGYFKSVESAGRFIKDTLESAGDKQHIGKACNIASKIREVLKENRKTAYGFTWKTCEDMLAIDGEEWVEYGKLKVSTHGRVKNQYGDLVLGTRSRHGKYRSVSYPCESGETKKMYIHRLVYLAFKGDIHDGLEVLHDDNAPLDNEGLYRNWLVDLQLGTRSENMVLYHQNKNNQKLKCDVPNVHIIQEQNQQKENIKRKAYGVEMIFVQKGKFYLATKNKKTVLVDCVTYDQMQHLTWDTDGDPWRTTNNTRLLQLFPGASTITKAKVTLLDFIYYLICSNPVANGHIIRPKNGIIADCRIENLEQINATRYKNIEPTTIENTILPYGCTLVTEKKNSTDYILYTSPLSKGHQWNSSKSKTVCIQDKVKETFEYVQREYEQQGKDFKKLYGTFVESVRTFRECIAHT